MNASICTDTCQFFRANIEELDTTTSQNFCRVIDELTALFEICQILEQSLALPDILRPVLEKITNALSLSLATITINDSVTGEQRLHEVYAPGALKSAGFCYIDAEPFIQDTLKSGRPVVVPDISKSDLLASFSEVLPPKSQHVHSLIVMPLRSETAIGGALCVIREARSDRGFDGDLRLLTVITSVLARAFELRQRAHDQLISLQEENERLQQVLESRYRPGNMVGNSSAMALVYQQIEQVAGTPTRVLIRGESGTGKELVASAIHELSPRAEKSFVKFNCAALPESIIESELFGHEKGAFTGAHVTRKGRFETANSGTIFLDEIGDISVQTQVKLLRVLQEGVIERVGSHESLKVDVRVIAATSRNLEEMMESGQFREDLYYRLNVFPIYVPSLKERKSDILQLADHFVERYAGEMNKPVLRISTAAIDLLVAYHWPGNVRELQNCIERAMLVCNGNSLEAHHLPPTLQMSSGNERQPRGVLQSALDGMEREMIVDSLKRNEGVMSKAASELGITERIMGLRVKKYDIDFIRFRS